MIIAFWSLLDQFKYLPYILFPKGNSAIVYQDTRNTHDVITFLYFFKMMKIVNFCCNVWIIRRNMLCRYHCVGTHRAGQRYKHLDICGLAYAILIPRGMVLTPCLSLFGYNNNRKITRRGV